MARRQVRARSGAPTVNLIDECHGHDVSTDDNIKTAVALFKDRVVLAGVEGYEGGAEYDVHERRYKAVRVHATLSEDTLIGAYPRFAKGLEAEGLAVVGVDCAGLSDELEAALLEDRTDPGTIAAQRMRTLHFVRTLAEEAQRRNLRGDLLLNCGSHHNDRIEALLRDPDAPLPDGWPDWNYVRIRSELYPSGSSSTGPSSSGSANT